MKIGGVGKGLIISYLVGGWLRGRDLNPRPLGYEPNELPDCSTPRHRREEPILAQPSRPTHGSCLSRRSRPVARGLRVRTQPSLFEQRQEIAKRALHPRVSRRSQVMCF